VTTNQDTKPDADSPNIATLWELDPPRKEPRARFATKAQYPICSFSDDSKTLATWDGNLQASVAEFWNVQTGQLIAATPEAEEFHGGTFSPDGSRFALSSVFSTGQKRNRTEHVKLTLHEVASGAEVWKRTWGRDSYGCGPHFNANGNLLQVYVEGRVEFLDAATGRTVAVARFRKEPTSRSIWSTNGLVVTPDRRLLPYHEKIQGACFEPTWLDRLLGFLHIPNRPDEDRSWDMVSVLEMETGREVIHLEGIGTTNPAYLSDDGRTLVTEHADHIAVWDLPGRPPLRWLLGVPAGSMLAAFVAVRLLRIRRKQAAPLGPQPASPP
jgi:hypothetical protein